MIVVEGLLWSPLAFLLLAPVFRNADASFEEAANICGAGLLSTTRHVTFGMARPALLALGLLVFIKASESFEVPALVGLPGSARVLTTTIYQQLTLEIPPDTGSASAFGVLLLVVMAVLLQIYSRVAAQTHRYQTVTGKGFRPRVVRLGRWRAPAGVLPSARVVRGGWRRRAGSRGLSGTSIIMRPICWGGRASSMNSSSL